MSDLGGDLTIIGTRQDGDGGAAADAPMRSMKTLTLAGILVAGLSGSALVAGFVWFAAAAAGATVPADPRAEGIVVLTGGTARIDTALRLLAERRGSRLLISGVNPAVGGDALTVSYGDEFGAALACCVDLGRTARDTIGNATETRDWVAAKRFASLLVVTSDYHMPRSMAELADAMPGIALVAVPITTHEPRIADWWRDPVALAFLAREYGKYLLTVARLALQPPPAAPETGG